MHLFQTVSIPGKGLACIILIGVKSLTGIFGIVLVIGLRMLVQRQWKDKGV